MNVIVICPIYLLGKDSTRAISANIMDTVDY